MDSEERNGTQYNTQIIGLPAELATFGATNIYYYLLPKRLTMKLSGVMKQSSGRG
jgi:hypothetical protein